MFDNLTGKFYEVYGCPMDPILSWSLLCLLIVLELGAQRSRWFGKFSEIGRTQILWNMRNINQKYKRQKKQIQIHHCIKKYFPTKVSVRKKFSTKEDVKLKLQLKWRRGEPQQQWRAARPRGGDWWWCVNHFTFTSIYSFQEEVEVVDMDTSSDDGDSSTSISSSNSSSSEEVFIILFN